MSPRVEFQRELGELREDVRQMAEWVEDGYRRLFETLEKKDADAMKRFVRHDRTLNDMQRGIESKCLTLFTRQQPVARDLRTVSAALKVVTDLERIGNHLSDMAELFGRMGMPELDGYSAAFPEMIRAAERTMRKASAAFLNRDAKAAEEVIAADDEIDDDFNQIKEALVRRLRDGRQDTDRLVDALMAAKYLEKIGDHAVNIGEWAVFQETGSIEDVRLL